MKDYHQFKFLKQDILHWVNKCHDNNSSKDYKKISV